MIKSFVSGSISDGKYKFSCAVIKERNLATLVTAVLSRCRLTKQQMTLSCKNDMWTAIAISLALWFLIIVTSYTLGWFVRILLVFALVLIVAKLVQGRNVF